MAAGVPVVSVVAVDNYPGLELRSGENITIVPEDDPEALATRSTSCRKTASSRRVGKGQRQFVMDHFSMQAVARTTSPSTRRLRHCVAAQSVGASAASQTSLIRMMPGMDVGCETSPSETKRLHEAIAEPGGIHWSGTPGSKRRASAATGSGTPASR